MLAVLTAAFILLQQAAFIIPAAAQTTRRSAIDRAAASRPTARKPAPPVSSSAAVDDPVGPSNSTAQTLPFSQDWTNTGLITANDNWSGVPGIEGFLGQDITTGTGTDPQTLLGTSAVANDLDVIANQTSTAITNGGVAEFHTTSQPAPAGTNPTVGLQGSGTADAPYLLLHLNTTGNTAINVSYNLRDIDCTADNAVQPVALQYRVGNTGNFTNVASGFVADATTGPSICTAVTAVSATLPAAVNNQSLVQVRIITTNAVGNDEWVGVDDISVTGTTGSTPILSINDVSQDEGNGGGTTAFTFTVSLSTATHGGVTFDICTADGTAQDDNPATEDNDYTANCLTGQTIPNGSDSYQFTVNVNADTTAEPNETFFVNVTNVVGATVSDGQGQGTIVNDDIVVTPIHDIQGNGAASPFAGQTVTTTGIVTLLRTGQNTGATSTASGFFLQTPDANADADPNTSQGIFVFTSSVPTVSVGDEVTVTGTAVEFNGLTEISPVTNVTVIDTGNPLPTAVTLDTTILDPTAPPTQPQLEKFEGMRMSAAALRTVAPNDNFFDVDTVLASVPRPVREPGIPASDPVPPDPTTGTPDCCIPIWDENPERLKVDTNGRAGAANNPYTSNVTFTAPSGPLDFSFGQYRLVLEQTPAASANMTAVAVREPEANEYTIASYNIENFNNNATQREKAALTVRTILHYPDIIGLVEIFDLADLQALRDEINNDAVAAGDPNPAYEAFLVEADGTSEDSDQDVGFLVKTSRVAVNSVTQEREEETFTNPNNGQPETLHDRPPFVLDATVDPSGANPRRVLVVVNHLRSFIDIELVSGEGVRVREKRKKQAESLADLLNDLQTANPGVPVVSVGDYNAYEFNSGYDDPISVIKGTPTEDDEIVVDQSPDLVNPDLLNLIETLPTTDRYSFIFEGTPQSLDHHLVNTVARSRNTGIAVARVNSDFPETPAAAYASNAAIPERNSDHDPVVSYYTLAQGQAVNTLIISEFRFHGPNAGLEEVGPVTGDGGGPSAPGTPAENDEFIEFYNNTDADITVSTLDGSQGWALVASDGAVRFIIPNGTVIPARHHFLAVNSDGYTLTDYGQPDTVLRPDGSPASGYNIDIPNESGIALFRTANPLFFTADDRLDAVGYASVPELYREGAGLTPGLEAGADELEYAWVRRFCVPGAGAGCQALGLPRDTADNAADFISVDTSGVLQSLGAPAPEGLSSPFQRNADFPAALLDPASPQAAAPNRVRDLNDTGENKSFGTMSIRRTITNNTGGPVDYLAFRVIGITTFPQVAGQADLRVLDSEDIEVTVNGSPVNVSRTRVETPPFQPNGGALNSSLGVGFINLDGNTLEDGESVSVQFLLGVEKTGAFRFYVNVEAFGECSECPLPESPAAAKWLKEQRAKARSRVQNAPRPKARGGAK